MDGVELMEKGCNEQCVGCSSFMDERNARARDRFGVAALVVGS
jgi:hypothetical protein